MKWAEKSPCPRMSEMDSKYICLTYKMQLLFERKSFAMSLVACVYKNRRVKKNVCNACNDHSAANQIANTIVAI